MKSNTATPVFESGANNASIRSTSETSAFLTACPPENKLYVNPVVGFTRRRGDLLVSLIFALATLFFIAMFWTQTGWANRTLPDNFGQFIWQQFGWAESGAPSLRLGDLLSQPWLAPLLCLLILLPAAISNLRASIKNYRWRQRFLQPIDVSYELEQWVRAVEFVGWSIAYALLIPILGFLVSSVVFGVLLPWRMGYRSVKWQCICLLISVGIVLIFRTGLHIETSVNIWLYKFLPTPLQGFLLTWF